MMHPLSIGKEGEEVVVRCLDCHCDDVCRLNELGCVEGARGRIISNQKSVILQVGEARLAIASTLAKTILVSPQ
ncbi:MAG: ferrous iron transport protein A [Balneolaceae bacterium]|nr:ferrous iron transport protein A [Balneolaceae bacterium]MBO6544784.1 ferrous iron transport protein A [Balneolaceae bacterium]MBO6646180.1 ferrous iron transport protein A [Balneolaceae bacterium]